ncbi:GNAT family N-acetyltransferase [Sphingomonas crusticola]|uniref:GNAT family N-acetyltransferase n=1 Tax=Sphingomonas crusticola TaxID=1697973 RepID=UPI000E26A6BF|nr:GNAT family N-acetyltransferase [Sphingomonas crusticola]
MFAITERLLLRPGWPEDAPALARTIGDERIVRNLTRVPWPYALGDAERFLALPYEPRRPRFLICLRDRPEPIGGIGIHGDIPELGYWIAHDHWGKGYATEAGRAVIALADASLRLPRLASSHATDNPASGKVLRKLGFSPTGKTIWAASHCRRTPMELRLFARDCEQSRQALAA